MKSNVSVKTASAALFLDTRVPIGEFKGPETIYPLKVKVTYLRERRYYGIGISLTVSDWERIASINTRGSLKDTKQKAAVFLEKAESIIDDLTAFSFPKFKKAFLEPIGSMDKQDVVVAFNEKISQLNKEGRIGTRDSYQTSINSLTEFKNKIKFTDIDKEFLQAYENYMVKEENSLTTVGIYLRNLRHIMNKASADGILKKEDLPFGVNKYQIPGTNNIKKALVPPDIAKIYYYDTIKYSQEDKARDFWMLSFFCNGMNVKDICKLKFKKIEKDRIIYHRSKTINTKKTNQVPIVVMLNDDIRAIIDKWGNKDRSSENYVFPILQPGITAEKAHILIKYFVKFINKYVRRIAKSLGLDHDISTYFARHSFATILRDNGATTAFIQEALGHEDPLTTQKYMDSFPDDAKRKFAETLTAFKTIPLKTA